MMRAKSLSSIAILRVFQGILFEVNNESPATFLAKMDPICKINVA